jgi:hypothetical protein
VVDHEVVVGGVRWGDGDGLRLYEQQQGSRTAPAGDDVFRCIVNPAKASDDPNFTELWQSTPVDCPANEKG